MKNRLSRIVFNILAVGVICLMSACQQIVEEEPLVMVDTKEDEITYNITETSVGDVVLTQTINCSYVQTKEQEVVLPVGGKIIDKVYVKSGDKVKAGDVLLELEVGNIEEDIAQLEFQIKKNQLLLGYLDKAEDFELESSYFSLVYDSKTEEEDVKNKDKRDESIKENYTYQREDYEDMIEFDTLKCQDLKNQLASSRVYATMSGKVMDLVKDLEGSTAKRGKIIMKIVDSNNGLFETNAPEASKYLAEGQTLNMSIVYGDAKGDYVLEPYNMSSWSETRQTFSVVEGPDGVNLEVGTSGTITAPIDKREQVLRISNHALYQADDKYYTYVLDENNMRKAQFLEVGLIGDEYTEILSGIGEGIKVVKR